MICLYISITHYFPFLCDYLMDSRSNALGDYLIQQLQHEKYFFKNISHNNKTHNFQRKSKAAAKRRQSTNECAEECDEQVGEYTPLLMDNIV